jgi:hypothetical protein
MLRSLFSGTRGAIAVVFLSALTLQAEMITPTLLVECDGYHVTADCVTGTAVYFENGTMRTQMLHRYSAPDFSSVPESGSVALVGMALAAMIWMKWITRNQPASCAVHTARSSAGRSAGQE